MCPPRPSPRSRRRSPRSNLSHPHWRARSRVRPACARATGCRPMTSRRSPRASKPDCRVWGGCTASRSPTATSPTSCSPSTAAGTEGGRSRVRGDPGAGPPAPPPPRVRDRTGGAVPRAAGAIRAALQLSRHRDARARARRCRAGGPRARGGQDPRAAARHPLRREGPGRGARLPDDLGGGAVSLADVRRGRDGGDATGRRGRGARGEARHGGARGRDGVQPGQCVVHRAREDALERRLLERRGVPAAPPRRGRPRPPPPPPGRAAGGGGGGGKISPARPAGRRGTAGIGRAAGLPALPFGVVGGTIIAAEGVSAFDDLMEGNRLKDLTAPEDRTGGYGALAISARDYLRALRVRRLMGRAYDELLKPFDAIATPTRTTVASPLDKPFRDAYPDERGGVSMIGSSNVVGVPAISVPNGFGLAGLPTGLSLVARAFDEAKLVRIARAYQARTDWHMRRPEVV